MAEPTYEVAKFLHVMTAVFMAAPLYNLIVVSERARVGKAPAQVDRYFENIIRGNSTRCYVFQITAMITGLALVVLLGLSFTTYLSSWRLTGKSIILLALLSLLSIVHFNIQPKIDKQLSQVTGDNTSPEIASVIARLRKHRKQLAATCLFLVITTIILAVRIAPELTGALIVLGGIFSWRVYLKGVPYGWI